MSVQFFEENERRRQELSEKLRQEMREDITDAVTSSRAEAEAVAGSSAMRRLFEDQASQIVDQYSRGVGTSDGFPQHISEADATKEARRRFIAKTVNAARKEVREKWNEVWTSKHAEVAEERKAEARAAEMRKEEQLIRNAQPMRTTLISCRWSGRP